jgi:hypothetical protein
MQNLNHCNCSTICSRWGLYNDGSGGWFCPYIPNYDSVCKKTTDSGKDMQPTIIEKVMLKIIEDEDCESCKI